jgi:hypothetical protein
MNSSGLDAGTVEEWFHGNVLGRFDHATPRSHTGPAGHVPALESGSGKPRHRRNAGIGPLNGSSSPQQVPQPGLRGDRAGLSSPSGSRVVILRNRAGRSEIASRASDLGGRFDPSPFAPSEAGAARPCGANAPALVCAGRPVAGSRRASAAGRPCACNHAPRDLADGCKGTYPNSNS